MSIFHFDYKDAPKGLKATRGDFARIGRLLLPAWRPSSLILACIATSAALGLLPPLLVRELVDRALPSHDGTRLNWLVAGMIGAPLLAGLIGVWQNYLVTAVGQGVMFDLRCRMYDRLIRQSLRFFTNTRSGEILSRLQNDVGGVQGVVTGTMVALTTHSVVVLSTLVVIFRMDWRLSLVAVGVLPLFILPTRSVGKLRGRIAKETQERLAELTSYIQETLSISGFLLARLFGAQDHERARFAGKAGAVRDLQVRQSMAGRWFLMWLMLFGSVGPALIYLVGGHEIIARALTLGTMLAFIAYLGRLYMPVSALVNVHVDIMSAVSLFRRIFEYMDLPVEIDEPVEPVRLEHPRGELRFERVAMAYDPASPTLADISFEAHPGQMVALVGPSGAGKTTLTYLASRLYDPGGGRITFDGVDLRQLSLVDLSRWMAMVTQETTLFNATLEENLRYAKQDATRAELERACRLAQMHDVIAALPEGYATMVGERGYKFSGGEKQRLAIARVVLRDPRLLILDEATSSLDSRSEALIQAALEPLLQGRTSLVIAHRLSTILRADLILVLDRGRIVERGTHAELLAHGGLYAKLYEEQFRAAEEAPVAPGAAAGAAGD
ncbi:MAG TPA: ABC transporter ATP-binding protein [Candidatus Eisenbacteria bacterium]|jgi:ATP-binding cassette subfamily B protein